MKMAKSSIITAGIDTSKSKLDIAIHGGLVFDVPNDNSGWQQAARRFAEAGVCRIGIEATGGYERNVTRYLQAAGFNVVVMQPLQVKAFAQLHLKRAKNDWIDAKLIATCVLVLDTADKLTPVFRDNQNAVIRF
jgi:transposase